MIVTKKYEFRYKIYMKKLIAVTIITIILLAAVITNATAESKKQDFNLGNVNEEIETTSTTLETRTLNNRNDNKTITQTKVQGIGKDHPEWKGFELKGKIDNVTTTSFDLDGKTINMDAAVTGKLQIKGTLTDGSFVKVEGKIVDEKYYAKEIKIEDNKGGDENDDDQISKTPEISITPTPSPTPTGLVQRIGNQYKINITGGLQDIIKALEDLLSKLKLQI